MMKKEISDYNKARIDEYRVICDHLADKLCQYLPESEHKIWHRHPVWFIDGNPVAGYSVQKPGVRLMFWSGADFDEAGLNVRGKKFKDASIFYTEKSQVNDEDLLRWIKKSGETQWDYKNIVKRRGKLERLK